MTTTEQVYVAREARLRALKWLAERPARIFADAHSVSVSGHDGEAVIVVRGPRGGTREAREYLGVTTQAPSSWLNRWTHHVGQPGNGVRVVFVEYPS